MADSSQVRSELNIFLQKRTASRLKNTLFNAMPTLDFLFSLNGDKKSADGLGRVQAGNLAIGRVNEVSRPKREKLFIEREYLPIVQTTKPDKTDVQDMTDYDADPVVPNWDTTNKPLSRFKQPRFKFSRKKMPYKVPHSEVRTAKNSATTEGQAARAVGSVYDVEVKSRTAVLCERLNDELFAINGQAGVPTDEDAVTWDHFHAIQNHLKEDNTYGGIDRSLAANDWWRGNYETTTFSGTFEDLIDYANYDLGMIAKGLGVQVLIVGKTLMKKAKAEARAHGYTMVSESVPDPEYGFKREMVCVKAGNRKVYITYDPAMDTRDTASGTYNVAALDPSTWTVCIHGDSNFKVSTPSDQTKVEGGDEADTGTIAVELLICCEVPSGNAWFTDVSA